MDTTVYIILGILLLIAGRRLYWLSVGIAGFALGMYLTALFIQADASWLQWLIAILAGMVGSVLAVSLQKLAVGVAGFLAGGYGLYYLWDLLNLTMPEASWLLYLVGGIVGTILVIALFDIALVVLTSWAGATLISRSITIESGMGILVFIALLIFGLGLQTNTLREEHKAQQG